MAIPQYVLESHGNILSNVIKNDGFREITVVTAADDWYMVDNKRDPFNVMDHRLFANENPAEGGIDQEHVDFLSNGFKYRRQKTPFNDGNYDYVYFAFAEAPFRNARAR